MSNVRKKYPFCSQNTLIKYGRRKGRQRYRCSVCSKFGLMDIWNDFQAA
ncbi:transposase-like zinc-binding domain-containing protein [Neisseria lisongii]